MSRISDLFVAKSQKLLWKRLPDNQVVAAKPTEVFAPDQAHYVLRLREMYLRTARFLWRKFYPVLHAYTRMGATEEHAVAGPGQLRELGDANLERVVNLNHRLSGPTPFRGGEVELLVGLYSVPGQDALKALVKTVGDIAGLGGIALGQVPQIADLVKTGVESILGLDSAELRMGVRDAFFKDNPIKTGIYVGVNAAADQVPLNQLWFRDGRLLKGRDPMVAKAYDDFDYLVLGVESHPTRDDWRGLPVVVEYEPRFQEVLARAGATPDQKRQEFKQLWGPYKAALQAAPYLTIPDHDNIADSVGADLNRRLKSLEAGTPFETRSFGPDGKQTQVPTAGFDLLYVEDRAAAGAAARTAIGNPFDS